MLEWEGVYNTVRPHQALGYVTPLKFLEKTMSDGSLSEFKELLHTLDNWREEILNYFDYPITNGFVEGKNNRIKTIKRIAYGYRNMDNFRLRILVTNSKGAGS